MKLHQDIVCRVHNPYIEVYFLSSDDVFPVKIKFRISGSEYVKFSFFNWKKYFPLPILKQLMWSPPLVDLF